MSEKFDQLKIMQEMFPNATFVDANGERVADTSKTIDHISQERKKVSLTEQWKKGELEQGYYYTKYTPKVGKPFVEIELRNYLLDLAKVRDANTVEVLAPVPSFEEYERILVENDSLKQICDELDCAVTQLREDKTDLIEENVKLKELLSKCVLRVDTLSDVLDFLKDKVVYKQSKQLADILKSTRDIIKEIDEVLK